jgi:hypothetical protein
MTSTQPSFPILVTSFGTDTPCRCRLSGFLHAGRPLTFKEGGKAPPSTSPGSSSPG